MLRSVFNTLKNRCKVEDVIKFNCFFQSFIIHFLRMQAFLNVKISFIMTHYVIIISRLLFEGKNKSIINEFSQVQSPMLLRLVFQSEYLHYSEIGRAHV